MIYQIAWALSLFGALLFFAAGVLLSRCFPVFRTARVEKGDVDEGRSTAFGEEALRSGDVLRTMLERECEGKDLKGAVIADELGLVVAATGEFSDVLAAYGAMLAGAGEKAREALPLDEVRKVVVSGNHDLTLTVRNIAAQDERFSLVTLISEKPSVAAS